MNVREIRGSVILMILLGSYSVMSQGLRSIEVDSNAGIESINDGAKLKKVLPLVGFRMGIKDNMKVFSSQSYPDFINFSWEKTSYSGPGIKIEVILTNNSIDTLVVDNLVPFGTDSSHVFITGKGNHGLSRTHLFRPGYKPVNVIVPDNAWELGYASVELSKDEGITGLLRRTVVEKAAKRRFETILYPKGNVTYEYYLDTYKGDWHAGLRQVFQKRYLHDVEKFDNALFEREDLKWVRHSYAIHLMMAWDKQFYNRSDQEYTMEEFLQRGQKWYGGDDVFGIWPTWPALGLDQRNQWDLFRDLPGGMKQLRTLADISRSHGAKFFICYNPWDSSTRDEDHYDGMADLIKGTTADGVVLDTQGSSSDKLQNTADGVRNGVVMYSEGMAVPKDMQGIVSGRVHNALYYPPMLNLNKFIKPEFAIFRVAELQFDRIRREYSLSLFNGYGTELNVFRPGRPDWIEEDYRYFGRTLRVLRENTYNFTNDKYTPLVATTSDNIYVNKWPKGKKIIYTIFSLIPEGYQGSLFEVEKDENGHFVDIWNHEEVEITEKDDQSFAKVSIDGFNKKWLGTNNEGAVGAVARFPEHLNVTQINGATVSVSADSGEEIHIWAGHPAYDKKPITIGITETEVNLQETFGDYRGDYIVQLFKKDELLDERIVTVAPGVPLLVSKKEQTSEVKKAPKGMVTIPTGTFEMKVTNGDEFIAYPSATEGKITLDKFYMDKYPVTNAQFEKFLLATKYQPADTTNFLKRWKNGRMPADMAQYPVVNVSYEDALAYAKWAGKRLPTEAEWQYAAQTEKQLTWPWGDESQGVKREKEYVTNTLTVSDIQGIDSTLCNTGNDKLDPVGSYSKGANPFGLEDLVGSVWQMTNDMYRSDSYQFLILKGGSYFKPASSWWYVQGGPRELTYRQSLLRVAPGFERNSTVGFRCVKDAK